MSMSVVTSTDTVARPEDNQLNPPWLDSGETCGLRMAGGPKRHAGSKVRLHKFIQQALSAKVAEHLLVASVRGADNSFWSGQTYGSKYHDAVSLLQTDLQNQREMRSELNWKKHFGKLSDRETQELQFLDMIASHELEAELKDQLDYLQTIIDANK